MAHNAKAGGEVGANGEFYKGGQFVADNPETAKCIPITKSFHQIQTEPYTWTIVAKNVFPVMTAAGIGTVSKFENGANRNYSKIILVENAKELCDRNGWNLETIKSFITRYNNGERTYKKE